MEKIKTIFGLFAIGFLIYLYIEHFPDIAKGIQGYVFSNVIKENFPFKQEKEHKAVKEKKKKEEERITQRDIPEEEYQEDLDKYEKKAEEEIDRLLDLK